MDVRRSAAILLTLLGLISLMSFSCAPAAPPVADAASRVERGRYLVQVTGCNDCHTPGTFYGAPDAQRMLSGSEMGWAGPWGVVYAANLTPDSTTGLGQWSIEDITKALRTGNRPDGRQLATVMPWLNFSNFTDEDVRSIATYLKSIPPVTHEVPKPVPPGAEVQGPVLAFPPPSAWDAPREGSAPAAH